MKCINFTLKVGVSYGRKMMAGYLSSRGHRLSRRQVRESLKRVNPVDHNRRREDIVRRQNPVPYNAPYYGNKLHCDQNEKLCMYGCKIVQWFKNSKNVLYAEEKCNNCVFVLQVCRPFIVLYLNGHMQCANNWMPYILQGYFG